MKSTIPTSTWDTYKHSSVYRKLILAVTIVQKRALFLLGFIIATIFSSAQSISPSTLNIAGGSAGFANYQIEWSVGESTSITTMAGSNLIVTSGVLQSFVANQPEINATGMWLPNEIRVYPVPTKDFIEINILHKYTGINKLELVDAQGRNVMSKQFQYHGIGRIEKWDLSKLPSGEYYLYIVQLSPVTLKPIKKGSFKIQKIK